MESSKGSQTKMCPRLQRKASFEARKVPTAVDIVSDNNSEGVGYVAPKNALPVLANHMLVRYSNSINFSSKSKRMIHW